MNPNPATCLETSKSLAAEASSPSGSTTTHRSSSPPLRILHVDDSPVCREVVRMVLSRAGHNMTAANDGRRGAERVASGLGDFDVVITDHEMPEQNGLQLATRLRELAYPGKILVFSGALTPPIISAYEAVGVDGWLAKPSMAHEIVDFVQSVANRSSAEA